MAGGAAGGVEADGRFAMTRYEILVLRREHTRPASATPAGSRAGDVEEGDIGQRRHCISISGLRRTDFCTEDLAYQSSPHYSFVHKWVPDRVSPASARSWFATLASTKASPRLTLRAAAWSGTCMPASRRRIGGPGHTPTL